MGISSVESELSSECVSVQVRIGVGSIERLDGAMDGETKGRVTVEVEASGPSRPGCAVLSSVPTESARFEPPKKHYTYLASVYNPLMSAVQA